MVVGCFVCTLLETSYVGIKIGISEKKVVHLLLNYFLFSISTSYDLSALHQPQLARFLSLGLLRVLFALVIVLSKYAVPKIVLNFEAYMQCEQPFIGHFVLVKSYLVKRCIMVDSLFS